MTTREEISSLIEEYLSNNISQKDENKLFELISSNKFIADEFIVRQRIDKAIRKKDIMELREQLSSLHNDISKTNEVKESNQVYHTSWYKMAAAILLLATVGYLIYLQFGVRSLINQEKDHSGLYRKEAMRNIDDPELKQDNGEKLKRESKKGQENTKSTELSENTTLAHNFNESAYYESFITNYRSNGIQIEMPSPGSTFTYPSEIIFKWKGEVGDPLELRIMNNKEDVVYETAVINEFTLNIPLDRGLYYWKIESEEDLLYLNKFYIK